jgi:hypothetical protein
MSLTFHLPRDTLIISFPVWKKISLCHAHYSSLFIITIKFSAVEKCLLNKDEFECLRYLDFIEPGTIERSLAGVVRT